MKDLGRSGLDLGLNFLTYIVVFKSGSSLTRNEVLIDIRQLV